MKVQGVAIVYWTFDHLLCNLWELLHCHNHPACHRQEPVHSVLRLMIQGCQDRNRSSDSTSASQIMPSPGTVFISTKHRSWLYLLWVQDKGRLIVGKKKKLPRYHLAARSWKSILEKCPVCLMPIVLSRPAVLISGRGSMLDFRDMNRIDSVWQFLYSQVFTETVLSHPKSSWNRVQCS